MTQRELKHNAPILTQIQKKGTGFTFPKGYLNKIETQVFNKLFLENLSKNAGYITPINYFNTVESNVVSQLQIKKTTSLTDSVPDAYFDTVEEAVFKRLEQEKKLKIIPLKKYWIPAIIAASLLLFIGIYNPFTRNKLIETAEIEAWIDAGYLELNSYEIAAIYETEIDDLTIDNQINTENLENYLTDDLSETIFYD